MPASRSVLGVGVLAAAVLLVGTGCAASVDGPPPAEARNAHAESSASPAPASDEPGGRTIVTIGDSIMAGLGVDPEDAWPVLLGDETGDTVVNLGCSGAGFVAIGDCGTDFAGLIDDAVAARPDLIIIQSSDNDVDEDQETLDAATQATIDALHAVLPHARIIGVNTLWNPSWEEPDAIEWSTEALHRAVHSVGGKFISIGQPLHDREDLLQFDDEHPNELGQIALKEVVLEALTAADVRV